MRTLLVMRGAPGAGKTTWIANHGLTDYTISPDDLRVLCSSTAMQPTGEFKISQEPANEQFIWNELIFKILEYRMSRGELTVIDATASKTKDIKQYKELADKYRYRVIVVDFTDVPLEVCLEQNRKRMPEYKRVPDAAIENIYARYATQGVPAGVKVIKKDEFDSVLDTPVDLSSYKKLVFIGDIHGCYDTLMQYPDFAKGELDPNTAYIFVGDYIDRGNQNFETLVFLNKIKDLPNVCLLEGNHEKHLRAYGNDEVATSAEFENKTKLELIEKGFTTKQARVFYSRLRQFSHISYWGLDILACHGGIPNLNTNLLYLPTQKIINGVGNYNDYGIVTNSWMGQTKENQFLIHGHRNTEYDETQIADRVFNLEGKVEFGGKLRIVELEKLVVGREDSNLPPRTDYYWTVVELDNIQPIAEDTDTSERVVDTVEDAITYLRNNEYIKEKKLDKDISSFNFTREAFMKNNWNRQTVLARGLFIDTTANRIMARSYEKFFRINETPETQLSELKNTLKFPVQAYVKENGFLGIVSYDYRNNDLFIASKSTNKGEYVEYFKKQLEPYREALLEYFRQWVGLSYIMCGHAYSFVFECVDPENDPHIIEYDKPKVVLLDAIYNDLVYDSFDYDTLRKVAEHLGLPVKERAFEIKDWESFKELYNNAQDVEYRYKGNFIEGFVFVDANGFMTKCKTGYYNFWKFMRSVADNTLSFGYIRRTGALDTKASNLFYGFCRELYKNDYNRETKSYPYKTDIISLRKMYQNR